MFSASVQQSKILSKLVFVDKAVLAINGAVSNHNVQMYAPANQPPDSHYYVSDSHQNLLFGYDYVETAIFWVLSYLTETLMKKVI